MGWKSRLQAEVKRGGRAAGLRRGEGRPGRRGGERIGAGRAATGGGAISGGLADGRFLEADYVCVACGRLS